MAIQPESLLSKIDQVMRFAQGITAFVVVCLFVIGVIDLILEIISLFRSGRITEVTAVIGVIEFVLLLFIIVEAYRTIVAYARQQEAKTILTLVTYTGIIAVIRKIIIFRPEEIGGQEALLIAVGYGVLLVALGVLVLILDQYGGVMKDIRQPKEE